eukprot:4334-Heterococcus_DN1.PRE.2
MAQVDYAMFSINVSYASTRSLQLPAAWPAELQHLLTSQAKARDNIAFVNVLLTKRLQLLYNWRTIGLRCSTAQWLACMHAADTVLSNRSSTRSACEAQRAYRYSFSTMCHSPVAVRSGTVSTPSSTASARSVGPIGCSPPTTVPPLPSAAVHSPAIHTPVQQLPLLVQAAAIGAHAARAPPVQFCTVPGAFSKEARAAKEGSFGSASSTM